MAIGPARRPLIVANWKMHKTTREATDYVHRLAELIQPQRTDVVLAPPFTALHAVERALLGIPGFALAGQDLFWEDFGAFTGEVSAPMLNDLGCRYVVIGHSERRRLFAESDEAVQKKVRAALRHGLRPIVCLGESLAEREDGRTTTVLTSQLQAGLAGIAKEDMPAIAVAYEPVWAIGTGQAATPQQATEVHHVLRRTILDMSGRDAAQQLRIVYGGSVTTGNVIDFLKAPEVDGVLIGGACLDVQCFATMAGLAELLSQER